MEEIVDVSTPQPEENGNKFWKNLLYTILGTTISIILTFGTNALLLRHRKNQDRKLSAMMVMSNIESFARTLEIRSDRMAANDSLAAWLLCTSYEDLELLPEEELEDLINQATVVATLNHDHTAENIFTNNVDTWKNVNNIHFIDNVGSCFSAINGVEEQFNQWARTVPEALHEVQINPDEFEGGTISMKQMHSSHVRAALAAIHNRRCWLRYAAATLRYFNQRNMSSINIAEQEVMRYTDALEEKSDNKGTPPDVLMYYTDAYTIDSLTSLTRLNDRIEELKTAKE